MVAASASRLDGALAHAACGRPVFPVWWPLPDGTCACGLADCQNAGKHPIGRLVPRGVLDASADADTIRAWWRQVPLANIGVPTGHVSGLVVLDVDVRGDGWPSLAALEGEYGELPPTWRAITGSGGSHILFAYPATGRVPNRVNLRPGLDVRGDGGYIVAPGSQHASGGAYEWDGDAHPDDGPLAPLPDWLASLLEPAALETFHEPLDTASVLAGVPAGERDKMLFRLAAKLRRSGVPVDFAERLLLEAAAACIPPFDERQALAKVRSAYGRYEPDLAPILTISANGKATPSTPVDDAGPVECNETDLGNGKRLVYWHGQNIRYVHQWQAWITWDGARWQRDLCGAVYAMAKDTAQRIYTHEAHTLGQRATKANEQPHKTAAQEETARDALAAYKARLKWAHQSESRQRIEAMMTLAQSEPGIPVSPNDLDQQPWLLNCSNGTLDLRSGELLVPLRSHLITKTTGVPFLPDVASPTWDRFLARIMGANPELMHFLQRAAGYSATGMVVEECMFFLHGNGGNGKSKFLGAVQGALGEYAKSVAPELLVEKKGDAGHPTEIADLAGARFTPTIETEDGKRFAESLFKLLTGGDKIKARRMREDFWEFDPTHKFWLAANHKPVIRGTDVGIWRRIHLIPFEVTITAEERDPQLAEKLRVEAPGVLAWIVRGCLAWQEHGLCVPEKVAIATQTYRAEMDTLKPWMDECCEIGGRTQTPARDLYASYSAWATANGERVVSATVFGKQLNERGFDSFRATRGMVRLGIRLKAPTNAD